jgi:CubicO group peptidase (beta-lactamase class C family)
MAHLLLPFLLATTPVASVLHSMIDRSVLPGAVVLVADKSRTLGIETAGMADIGRKQPMRADTLFWIASMTKPITAVALMMLVDEGKVSLDDPVSKYVPELKDLWLATERSTDHVLLKRPKAAITVRTLLNHTSGLPPFSKVEDSAGSVTILPLWLAVRSYATSPLESEPGTKWAYCNSGFNVAGRIIEVVSGMPYETFLKKRLFDPLGMKDTTFSPTKRQLGRLAKSYRPNGTGTGFEETAMLQAEHPLTARIREPWPAGGLFSTAGDMGRFCQTMLSGGIYQGKRLLSKSAVSQMTMNQVVEGGGNRYGLGWFLGGEGAYLHMGAYGTNMIVYPKHELVVVILFEHVTIQQGDSWKTVYNPINDAVFKQYPRP